MKPRIIKIEKVNLRIKVIRPNGTIHRIYDPNSLRIECVDLTKSKPFVINQSEEKKDTISQDGESKPKSEDPYSQLNILARDIDNVDKYIQQLESQM